MPSPRNSLIPADFQPALPMHRLIREEAPSEAAVHFDVLIVGGGPAGLAGAIELARLSRSPESPPALRDLRIGVLEKARSLGEHCLSGAVVNPVSLRKLFPDLDVADLPLRRPVSRDRVYLLSRRGRIRIPTPPTMRNRGYYVASLCEIVRWLGARAEELDVDLLTGFAAESLLVGGPSVHGVRTAASGLDRDGHPGPAFLPSADLAARITLLAEGSRGALAQAWLGWQGVSSPNPQIYALGVKELWRVERAPEAVIHTLGWPLPNDTFGGSFCYPMADDLVALGLVVGLDYRSADFDPHERLQDLKEHPLLHQHLENGELLEWGSKTIPEGGYHSLPDRLHGGGVMLVGDVAGLVDVPSLKGIHYAIESGILAARAAFAALAADDTSAAGLRSYDESLLSSYVGRDLRRTRNMRQVFKRGLVRGGTSAGLMTLLGGRLAGPRIPVRADAREPRRVAAAPPSRRSGKLHISKVEGVFRSGTDTRDDIPSHLLVPDDVPPEVASFYASMCPAGVYERQGDRLVVNPSNCVDCKTTDVLGPRWLPREGGVGPRYQRM